VEAKLVVLAGKHKDREIPLPETIFLIGRDRQCHLRPHCALVSKLHCAIAAWAGKVRVRDLESRNGTLLNGRPINGEALAGDGDELQVGTLQFAFRVKNDDGLPLAGPIFEGDVRWLLEQPSDSALPSSTLLGAALGLDLGQAEEDSTNVTRKSLSAGKHLRDYLEKRKRAARPSES